MKKALVSCRGGKDSWFAAIKAIAEGYEIKGFLNVLSEEGQTSRAHGIPAAIVEAQAAAANIPMQTVAASWAEYEQKFTGALLQAKEKWNISYAVFGDIDLLEHQQWEEKICSRTGLSAIWPLWGRNRKELVLQMIDDGMQMLIVSCNTTMGERFLGKYLTTERVAELEALGIDPCGEEGEFHTLVTACKMFQNPFEVNVTGTYLHNDYWYAHLELKT